MVKVNVHFEARDQAQPKEEKLDGTQLAQIRVFNGPFLYRSIIKLSRL